VESGEGIESVRVRIPEETRLADRWNPVKELKDQHADDESSDDAGGIR